MKSVIISAAAVYWAALASSAGVEQPKTSPIAGAPTVQGCFSSPGKLVLMSNETYNSIGKCGTKICLDLYNKTVAASSQGVRCYCGDKYPAQDTLVDDSECNVTCPGWGPDNCGGAHTYTVYNTGKDLYNVEFEPPSSASSKPSGSSASDGSTSSVTVTQTSDPNAGNSSSPNTAGIAAGVVVAVVFVGAIAGGGFFYLRRRRNREIEEEHRRNAAVNSFIGIGKPPSSSGGLSISDSRLDPVMAQRRMSDGSIADNHDYSRKILRVTNA